jgi:hypothetical protein
MSALGALVYEPDHSGDNSNEPISLDVLAHQARDVLEGDATDVLAELIALNGSSGGARPKALIGVDKGFENIMHGVYDLPEGYQPWMVKFPNSQDGLRRLPYRQTWDRDFLAFCRELEKRKPVVFCGDLNVSHQEIDLARPKANRKNAGFSDEERAGFDAIVEAGFIDTFRAENEGVEGAYT